ncbi:YceD family protein [Brevundimonas sp.]|uniref:YceD family protein n=1 Tax=Brevundimonas sp. TaxID=1871086 RepID=UPI002FD9E4F8
MNPIAPPLSDIVRVNQIGAGLSRTLTPDDDVRRRIARELDLASLDAFEAALELTPHETGWRLSGRIRADAVQSCGLTLEPLPVVIDRTFALDLAEGVEDAPEIEVSIDDEAPDLIEDGKIDLGQYAVEQLALSLDPFPRKPGAEFVQPPEPNEINPFAVLKQFKSADGEGQG